MENTLKKLCKPVMSLNISEMNRMTVKLPKDDFMKLLLYLCVLSRISAEDISGWEPEISVTWDWQSI